MKTKLFTLFFALVASVGTICAESGTCGDNLTWDLTNGVLTISGTGAMTEYGWPIECPWHWQRDEIKSAVINNGVTDIGNFVFSECTGLTSVSIGNDVTSIGYESFYGCVGLTSIEIPNSVTSIGNSAFYGCTGMTSVSLGNSVESIRTSAFQWCTSLTSIEIPNSVTSIGFAAFMACTGLTSASIGRGVTSIEDYVFSGCTSLTAIHVDSENPNYCDIDGVLFNINQTELIRYPIAKAKAVSNYVIPNSVTSIAAVAFEGCDDLTSITIPNSVTSIGGFAFQMIESSLSHVVCKAVTPPTLSNCVFDGIDSSVSLYVPDESVNAYKAADQWKEFNIRPISALPQGVENIYSGKAQSAKALRSGQVLILRGDRTYTLTGQEVK